MSKESPEEFVAKAIGHAKAQWCLDDEEVVREWCGHRADSDTPETLVDESAMRYGLIHATDGAAHAVGQLMGEYKDVIGKELREAAMARLHN
jgi:hypothetical protein